MRATGYDEMAMREGRAMPALREPLLAAWLAQLLSAGAARVAAAPPVVPAPLVLRPERR